MTPNTRKNPTSTSRLLSLCIRAAVLYTLAAALGPGQSLAQELQVTVDSGVRVRMRDGVMLVADVYRPDAPGRFPVLVERTPYNRQDPGTGTFLASHGYVVVLQDTRGRYASEGEFYPFLYESQDGYDTIEWAAALDCSDGRVGMFGGSYVGATQMLAAADLDRLAKMPTRDQAISLLMAVMKAPTEKFVRTLNEVPGKLVRTVAAIRDQKQSA